MKIYEITPIAKPRLTRRDKWKGRPCVLRFFRFRDRVRELDIKILESGSHVIFVIPMPKSWSKRKRGAFNTTGHRGAIDKAVKNDLDNLLKSLMDSVFKEDSGVWDIRISKIWGYTGKIYVSDCQLAQTWLDILRSRERGHGN